MNRKEYEERIAKIEKELDELKEVEIVDDDLESNIGMLVQLGMLFLLIGMIAQLIIIVKTF